MTSNENTRNEDIKPPEPGAPEGPDAEVTPGQLLSRKREALGLTVQQVADKLHITMHYVRALEADAHDKLPGVVFIRGYIRAYSNYLKLDPSVIVNVFNEYIAQRENNAQQATYTRNRHRRDRNLPWIAVSGVAFVVIAVALWYFGAGASPQTGGVATPASVSTPAVSAAAPVSNAGTSAPTLATISTTRSTGLELQPSPTATPSMPSAEPAAPTVAQPTSPVTGLAPAVDVAPAAMPAVVPATVPVSTPTAPATLPLNSTPPATPASTPASTPSSTPVATSPVPAAAQPAAAIPVPASDTQVISVDAGGPDVVEIVFSGESLVQIDDGSARQIYRDIRLAGDRLQVNGTGPFNVLLGDASSAELHLNGKRIEFTENIRIDNSARLTIGL